MNYRSIVYTIEKESTILAFLKEKQGFSARQITKLRQEERGILLGGAPAKTNALLHAGDELRINIPLGDNQIEPVDLPLEVVYEDEDVLVVNKPAFLVCHPTRNHQGDTLANAVAYHLAKKGKSCTFRAVNRLDRDTTGLVVIALHRYAAGRLRESLQKTYVALASGQIAQGGTIDLPIERVDARKITRRVGAAGERAVTHFEVAGHQDGNTLLTITLETGRTHQIRVHFAAIGHPLIGDTMYGTASERINHQCLHCGEVRFAQPVTGEAICVRAAAPWEQV